MPSYVETYRLIFDAGFNISFAPTPTGGETMYFSRRPEGAKVLAVESFQAFQLPFSAYITTDRISILFRLIRMSFGSDTTYKKSASPSGSMQSRESMAGLLTMVDTG